VISIAVLWYSGRAYRIVVAISASATTMPGSAYATYAARSVRVLSGPGRRTASHATGSATRIVTSAPISPSLTELKVVVARRSSGNAVELPVTIQKTSVPIGTPSASRLSSVSPATAGTTSSLRRTGVAGRAVPVPIRA
jgi:hypothetical protein